MVARMLRQVSDFIMVSFENIQPSQQMCRIARVRLPWSSRSHIPAASGTSSRITRMILLHEPPSLDIGEMTDKGSINQRAVLDHRGTTVETLYSPTPDADVITP